LAFAGGGAWLLSPEPGDVVEACCADASGAFAGASCASAEFAVIGDLPRPPPRSPIVAAAADVPLAGAAAGGCVLTTIATATGGIAGVAALAAVVVVVASVAAVSSWLFLSRTIVLQNRRLS